MTELEKNIQKFNDKILQYRQLKDQQNVLKARLEKLNEEIKKEIVQWAGHPTSQDSEAENPEVVWDTNYKIKATLTLKSVSQQIEQGELDQLFTEKNLFNLYAEPHVPEWAIEEAALCGDLLPHEVHTMQRIEPRLVLKVERTGNVQSQDDVPSEREID